MFNTSKLTWELAKSKKFKECYEYISDDELKVLQKELLDLLIAFIKICDDNNIDYVLTGGSLLGAIRHKGFIPWDDDVDVALKREDYDRFKEIVNNHELNKKYSFIYPQDSMKITCDGKFMKRQINLDKLLSKKYFDKNDIYIDVLAIDYVPDNKIKANLTGKIVDVLNVCNSSKRCYRKNDELLYLMSKYSKKLKVNLLIRKIISLLTFFLNQKKSINLIEFILKKSEEGEFSTIALGVKRYKGEKLKTSEFFPPKIVRFENINVKIPNDAHAYLSLHYGEYMKLPPKNEQGERLVRLKENWKDFVNE